MSEIVEHTPTRRRFGKYLFTRLSNSLPRVRRSRRIADSKPVPRVRAFEPARVLFEQLEPRYLLSADISPFVIAMADAGHDLTLQFDSSSDMLQVINDQSGQTVGEQQASRTSQIQIIGTNENDRLTINLTAGFALPLGINFDAAGGQDQLILGGSADAVMHRIDSNGSGKVLFETGNVGGNLSYSGIEQLTDSALAQNRSIAVTDAGNNVSLISNVDGITALTTSQGEKLGFGTSAKSLSIDAEAANLDNQATLQADHIALHGLALSIGGTLDAHGIIGGMIDLTGNQIDVHNSAVIDATGLAGGGNVHVGGDLHGSGALPNAETTLVERGAAINVSAIQSGQGGSAVIWADGNTFFAGSILARGGSTGGDGGFAEVSGKGELGFYGSVDLSAPQGAAGTFSFANAANEITTAGGTVSITAATIGTLGVFDVGSGTLTLDATSSGIKLNSINAGTLNVTAAGNITEAIGSNVTVSGTATFAAATFDVDLTGATANHFGTLDITAAEVSLSGNITYTALHLTGTTDIAVSDDANITLTDTSLKIGSLPTIILSGITSAELTDTGSTGRTLDVKGFTGTTTLTGGTGGDTYVYGNKFDATIIAGIGNNDLLDFTNNSDPLSGFTVSATNTITDGTNTIQQTLAPVAKIDVNLTG